MSSRPTAPGVKQPLLKSEDLPSFHATINLKNNTITMIIIHHSTYTFEFDSCRKNQGQPHIFGEDECDNSKQQRLCLALRTFWPALKVFFLGQSSSCWSLGKHVFYTSYVDDALDLCYPWTYAVLRHLTRLTYLTWMWNKTGGLLVQVSTFSN